MKQSLYIKAGTSTTHVRCLIYPVKYPWILQVFLDGQDLRQFHLGWLRQQVKIIR